MKISFLFILLLSSINSLEPIKGCLVTNGALERSYWFEDVPCSEFVLNEEQGDRCVDCCAAQTSSTTINQLPAPPEHLAPLSYRLEPNGSLVDVWDNETNTKIATMSSQGATALKQVYVVISTSFKLQEKDGKGQIVSEGETKDVFTLSEEGVKRIKEKGGKIEGVEISKKKQ